MWTSAGHSRKKSHYVVKKSINSPLPNQKNTKRTHFHRNLKPIGRQIVNQSKSGVAAKKRCCRIKSGDADLEATMPNQKAAMPPSYTSWPIVKIAVGSIYTLQDLTNACPASVPRKPSIASKSDTSILAT